MSGLIDSFCIKVGFAPDGTVDEVRYWDQEGCGHEHLLSLGDDLDDVVQSHLRHMDMSHGQRPPRGCNYRLTTVHAGDLRCTLEPHDSETKHRFEV